MFVCVSVLIASSMIAAHSARTTGTCVRRAMNAMGHATTRVALCSLFLCWRARARTKFKRGVCCASLGRMLLQRCFTKDDKSGRCSRDCVDPVHKTSLLDENTGATPLRPGPDPLAMLRSPLTPMAHCPGKSTWRRTVALTPSRYAGYTGDAYALESVIGKGAFGLVTLMRSESSGQLVAMKTVDRFRLTSQVLSLIHI